MFRLRPALYVPCFAKKKRCFAIKAVVIDSSIIVESKKKAARQTSHPHPLAQKSTLKQNSIEIEGVTDVLTKYRAKLREKNIFQGSLSKPSQAAGDAHLLHQVKKTLETLSDTSEDGLGVEMEAILNYITHRGLKLYVAFFKTLGSVENEDFLLKALKKKPRPIHILQQVEISEVVDEILCAHKISPRELIIFSNHDDILSLSKKKEILTCRFGSKGSDKETFSNRTTHAASDSDGVQSVIEENNGFTFL